MTTDYLLPGYELVAARAQLSKSCSSPGGTDWSAGGGGGRGGGGKGAGKGRGEEEGLLDIAWNWTLCSTLPRETARSLPMRLKQY